MKNNISQYIPFGLALISVLFHLSEVYIFEYQSINFQIIYGLIGLIITLVFILLGKKYWKYIFLVLLIVSFTSLIRFSNLSIYFGINFIQIELSVLPLLILHLVLNPEVYSELYGKEKARQRRENKNNASKRRIERYEEQFGSKKISELEKIVNENKLLPEAVEAAKRLLELKKNNTQ